MFTTESSSGQYSFVAISNSWRSGIDFFRPINVLQTVITWKKSGFILAGSSKWHSIMRRMFIPSTFQKSYAKTVYFREIPLQFFHWVSTWLVYTRIQVTSPWIGGNSLKRITSLGYERESVPTLFCLFL